MEGLRGWSYMQCSIPSGPNRKKPISLQHCIQGIQQIRADEECPWILEQGQHYNILSPGQTRTVVCAGDSVLKFTEAGGHGQEAVISEALGVWAAKILRHVQVPIAVREGVYYLDLLQQETVRLLTLEFMGVEGPPAPFWALLLFALCWLAPRKIAADLGVFKRG